MEINQLKLLGLNTYETKVLLALIQLGKSKVSQITTKSKVPNGQIYNTLDSLVEKNLINIVPEKVKHYSPKPISHLKELLKQKKLELTQLEKDLENLEILEKNQSGGEITIHKGVEGFFQALKESGKAKNFNYNIKWKAETNVQSQFRKVKQEIENGVNFKTLYNKNIEKNNLEKWKKLSNNFKFIETNGVSMMIHENSTLISIVELDSTILIKSKELSNVMKQLYQGYFESKK